MSFADMSQESFTGDAERAVLVGIDYKDAPGIAFELSLAELARLTDTAGAVVVVTSRSVLTLRIP